MPATRSPAKALFGAALLMFAAAWAVRGPGVFAAALVTLAAAAVAEWRSRP